MSDRTEYNRTYGKQKRAEALSKGLCSNCWKEPVTPGKKSCEACRTRRAIDPKVNRRRSAMSHRRRRAAVIQKYGGVCVCCSEDRLPFLALDHVDGGGSEHRREVGHGGPLMTWIIANNYPPVFQVLCHNCNISKGLYGKCPHQFPEMVSTFLTDDSVYKPRKPK